MEVTLKLFNPLVPLCAKVPLYLDHEKSVQGIDVPLKAGSMESFFKLDLIDPNSETLAEELDKEGSPLIVMETAPVGVLHLG